MATLNIYQNLDTHENNLKLEHSKISIKAQDFEWLICDGCSSQFIDTNYGYVCPECGLTPKENYQHLQYDKPYDENSLQYAPLGFTQIGTIRERLTNSNSSKLDKLNRLQSIRKNEEIVLEKSKIEISRIFYYLNLAGSLKDLVFEKFKKIRRELRPGTKYRSPEKLIPICIYYTLKFQNVSINEKELLEVSKISKKEFNNFKLQINEFLPQYKFRKRKEYVLQKVSEIRHTFDLNMEFYFQTKKILYKLWDIIKNTKDDVVAGLVSSISVLCSFTEKATINSICKKLGIKMSTIQSQVKKNIVDRFKVSGFISLVKSAGILKELMQKLGIIQPENTLVEIKFGNTIQVYNHFGNVNYYFLILHTIDESPIFITLMIYGRYFEDLINGDLDKRTDKIIDLHFEWFSPAKGP